MAQVKIYPSTQAQVQAVQNTVNEINGKITTPTYQAKIVTPTTAQQLVEPDNGYDALSSVTVNPANITDLENWITRNDQTDPIYLSLTVLTIPSYACYQQTRLVTFEDVNATSIGVSAFQGCTSLQEVDVRNATLIDSSAFQGCTSLQEVDVRNATSIGVSAFQGCTSLQEVDVRNATSIGSSAFQGCSQLRYVDARKTYKIGNTCFNGCSSLVLLDITQSNKSAVLSNSNALVNTPDAMIILVLNDDEKAYYQSATSWSLYARKIKTIAEIEVLYGNTYDNLYFQWFGHERN